MRRIRASKRHNEQVIPRVAYTEPPPDDFLRIRGLTALDCESLIQKRWRDPILTSSGMQEYLPRQVIADHGRLIVKRVTGNGSV